MRVSPPPSAPLQAVVPKELAGVRLSLKNPLNNRKNFDGARNRVHHSRTVFCWNHFIFDQVKSDLSRNNLSPWQQGQVRAIVSEVEVGNASIGSLVIQKDLLKAVATAKELQAKIYNAQLILAGQKTK